MRNRKRRRLDLHITRTFLPRKRQKSISNQHTHPLSSLPDLFSCPQSRLYLPNPPQFPSQAGTRCVPTSSGRAADPQQAVPPSPGPGRVVTAETPPSAALRMRAHLYLRDIPVMVISLGPLSPALIPSPQESRRALVPHSTPSLFISW